MTKIIKEYKTDAGESIPQEQVEEWLKFKKQVDEHDQHSKQVLKKLKDSLAHRGFNIEDL